VTTAEAPARVAERGSLAAFFLLTFALTETCFIAAARMSAPSPLRTLLLTLGTFAPGLVSLALTWRLEGTAGLRALAGRITRGPVAARWFVIAVLFTPVLKLLAAVLVRVLFHAWPRFDFSEAALIPFAIAISTPVQAGEELGWRGYALPRMAARMGVGPASVLLGALWAVWHLPLFFAAGVDKEGQSFVVYALSVIGLSVVIGWLYAGARGNLLVVMLFHAAVNNTKDFVPSGTPGAHAVFGLAASPTAWSSVAILGLIAIGCLVKLAQDDPSNRAAIAAIP